MAVTVHVVTPIDAKVDPPTEQPDPTTENVTAPVPEPPEVVKVTEDPAFIFSTAFEIKNVFADPEGVGVAETVGVGVAETVGATEGACVADLVAEAVGATVGACVADLVAEAVGATEGACVETFTPLFHTSFAPDLTQVYLIPAKTVVALSLLQLEPALVAALDEAVKLVRKIDKQIATTRWRFIGQA